MASETTPPLLSYDDYAHLGDDVRGEVVEGVFVMTPTPNRVHQRLVYHLHHLIQGFLDDHPVGDVYGAPFDVVFRAERPATVLQPDLLFLTAAHAARATLPNVQGAPDLAVEVVSPSSVRHDSRRKKALYAQYGVGEYWIVWPEAERIEVYQLGAAGAFGKPAVFEPGEAVTTPLLPGFTLDVAALFAFAAGGAGQAPRPPEA